jgi:hypothetical protein
VAPVNNIFVMGLSIIKSIDESDPRILALSRQEKDHQSGFCKI